MNHIINIKNAWARNRATKMRWISTKFYADCWLLMVVTVVFFLSLSLFLVTLHNDDLSFESLFTPCFMFWAISCIYTYMYRCSGLWPWFFGAFFPKQFFFSRCYIIVSAVRYLLAVVAIYWSCLWIIRTFTITPVILP